MSEISCNLAPQFQVLSRSINQNALTRHLIDNKYAEICKKHGAAEFIYDDVGDIVNIISPVEYIEEADRLAIQLYMTGSQDERRRRISAPGLVRLAQARCSFYAAFARQLTEDPLFLRDEILLRAKQRKELIPDINGDALTLPDLLSNARYIGNETRYIVHNALQDLGYWSVIVKYLQDVAELDKERGRLGAVEKRQQLIDFVAGMVDQGIELVEQRVKSGVVTDKRLGKFWYRVKSYEDWTGAQLALKDPDDAELDSIMRSSNLQGACVRIMLLQPEDADIRVLRADLVARFTEASEEEISECNDYLVESLTKLKAFQDFLQMLDYSAIQLPTEHRYKSFAMNTRTVQKILMKATIERHFTTIESLDKSTVFDKVWKEVNALSKKVCGGPLEQFVGFAPVAPRWHIPSPPFVTPSRRRRSPSPSPPPRKTRRPFVPHSDDYVVPPPANINPYYEPGRVLPPSEALEHKQRDGPKTRPVVGTETDSGPATEEEGASQASEEVRSPSGPVFFVAKEIYEIFEMLFLGGKVKGLVDCKDFKKAMVALGFEPVHGHGSSVTLEPPSAKDKIFIYHQRHGGNTELYPALRQAYLRRLQEEYGWEWSWFALKSDAVCP